eukprot:scaffold170_cov136-Chaetoceros_neogracile.AAC.1
MLQYSYYQLRSISLSSLLASPLSVTATAVLMVSVLRSEVKLTAPSRRLFFAFCVYGFMHAIAAMSSTMVKPEKKNASFREINSSLCNTQG